MAAVAEDKEGSTFRVFAQALADRGVETVEAFALIPSSE
jgi:hypothetical protein